MLNLQLLEKKEVSIRINMADRTSFLGIWPTLHDKRNQCVGKKKPI